MDTQLEVATHPSAPTPTSTTPPPLEQLLATDGVLSAMLPHLGAKALANLAMVSTPLNALASRDFLWALLLRDVDDVAAPSPAAAAAPIDTPHSTDVRREYARRDLLKRWGSRTADDDGEPSSVHTVRLASRRPALVEGLRSQLRTLQLGSPAFAPSPSPEVPPAAVAGRSTPADKENVRPLHPNRRWVPTLDAAGRSHSTPDAASPPRARAADCLGARLKRDLYGLMTSADASVSAFPDEPGSLRVWSGSVRCPHDSSLHGGTQFMLKLQYNVADFEDGALPRVTITRPACFHPNIGSDGSVCPLALLTRCNPADSVRTVLQRVCELIGRPCFAVEPLNAEATTVWYGAKAELRAKARAYALGLLPQCQALTPVPRTARSESAMSA